MAASNALISVAEAKTWIGIPTLDISQDTRLDEIIDSVSGFFEIQASHTLKRPGAPFTGFYYGNGKHEILLKEFPSDKPTAVYVDSGWTFASPMTTSDYEVIDGILLVSKIAFPQGIRNVKIIHAAAYATIPADLKQATKLAVEFIYRSRNEQRLGKQTVTKVGETTTFAENIPKQILDMLNPYLRDVYIKATLGPLYGKVTGDRIDA